MKTLYMIGGTMGVGKTTACQHLKQTLDRCVFLDGDWCWDAHPLTVNEETKAMVQRNIVFLLNQFLHCSAYENVVFCWVLHQQEIWDSLLAQLDLAGCRVCTVALVCSEEALRTRLQKDVDAGLRQPDVMARSAARLPLYNALRVQKLEVTGLTPQQTAEALQKLQADRAETDPAS